MAKNTSHAMASAMMYPALRLMRLLRLTFRLRWRCLSGREAEEG
jgi:hypothetical protein